MERSNHALDYETTRQIEDSMGSTVPGKPGRIVPCVEYVGRLGRWSPATLWVERMATLRTREH